MDKFPLLWDGRPVGELVTEQEALYTWFEARCRPPGEGLWCGWAVGDLGELRLGILEPRGDQASIRRRFSGRLTGPIGRLRWGEVRPARLSEPGEWKSPARPEDLFGSSWLKAQLRAIPGALIRAEGGRQYAALPYDPARPFPLERLFCFARVRRIGGRDYAVFAFDTQGRPVF